MARKDKRYEDDDGRTIVNMDVPGMPWYEARVRREKREERARERNQCPAQGGDTLDSGQTIRYTLYSILAALTVLGVVGGAAVLFVLILWLCWR